jgi:hypothetical protein
MADPIGSRMINSRDPALPPLKVVTFDDRLRSALDKRDDPPDLVKVYALLTPDPIETPPAEPDKVNTYANDDANKNKNNEEKDGALESVVFCCTSSEDESMASSITVQ